MRTSGRIALTVFFTACVGSAPMHGGSGGGTGAADDPTKPPPEDPVLAARTVDYGQALRTAAVKLVGTLPTMDETAGVTDAESYAAQIDKYLADPRFTREMFLYFRDMFKMGGTIQVSKNGSNVSVNLDLAPAFAAELVVKDRPITDLFTATQNTCPTLNGDNTFTDASCGPMTATGVITDPGVEAQFYSNMAFRRVRWLQETFVCTKFPAEYSGTPVEMGNGQYVSPWPFQSVTGGTTAQIDFQDTRSVVCANCHSTMNHIAPLLANFDIAGVLQSSVQVKVPVPMMPAAKLSDWLPTGEALSWRFNQPVQTLADLGAAMAKDPDVIDCQVARAWNWAMSKTDIVTDAQVVPQSTIASLEEGFTSGGYQLKALLKAIFTHDDFVRF